MPEDYYKTLGVGKSASADEIKKAYRNLAKKHHPDRNRGDKQSEQKFKDINNAYDTLKDSEKRRIYDQFGPEAVNSAGASGGFGGGFSRNAQAGGFGGGFSDIFEDLFGAMGGSGGGAGASSRGYAASNQGADLRYDMQISLEEAFTGVAKSLSVRKFETCDTCNGTGSADNAKPSTCPSCNGSGTVRMQQGFFVVEQTCGTCKGSGVVITNPCKTCHGEGRVQKRKKLNVKIPLGVDEGTRIRLSGEGEAGTRGGKYGDLYVFISVKEHSFFQRNGVNLLSTIPIKITTATLGGTAEIPTIDGKTAKITIPEGTQAGTKFRLRTKGMPQIGKPNIFGDMFVVVDVKVPKKISKEQKELLRQFAEIEHAKKETSENKFFNKVKDFFEGLKNE